MCVCVCTPCSPPLDSPLSFTNNVLFSHCSFKISFNTTTNLQKCASQTVSMILQTEKYQPMRYSNIIDPLFLLLYNELIFLVDNISK